MSTEDAQEEENKKQQRQTSKELSQLFDIPAGNKDSLCWKQTLSFKSPISTESDWYSTKTFQIFLDSLDINQQPLRDSKSRESLDKQNGSTNTSPKQGAIGAAATNANNKSTKEQSQTARQKTPKKSSTIETILSAEALKILSELPDLSHMSATNSFIFPKGSSATKSSGSSKSTSKR